MNNLAVNDFVQESNNVEDEFLEQINQLIPDLWNITSYGKQKNWTINLHFTKTPAWARKHLKYHLRDLLQRKKFSANTVQIVNSLLNLFFQYLQTDRSIQSINDIRESDWLSYIELTTNQVRESMFQKKHGIIPKTAYTKTYPIIRFLSFLTEKGLYNGSWLRTVDVLKIFPFNISRYFSLEEKAELSDLLAETATKNKNRSIPYPELIDIMQAVYSHKDIYFRTAAILAAHTGLRTIEILNLPVNCLEPVDENEAKLAKNFIETQSGLGGIAPDWSQSYWLVNYPVAKGKKNNKWGSGTPILVSKTVADAIIEITEHTKEIRHELKKDNLFLRKHQNRKTSLLGTTTLTRMRNNFILENNLPYFTMHQFRHTFATILADEGVDISYIRKYLNHISEDMTASYINSDIERRTDAMEAYASGNIYASESTKEGRSFKNAYQELTHTQEWASLVKESQLDLFEILLRRHNIGFTYSDHGICMLPKGTACHKGMESINPCYLAECDKYSPDANELPFFVDLIQKRDEAIARMVKLGIKAVNHKNLTKEKEKLVNIVYMLNKKKGNHEKKTCKTKLS